MVVFFVDVLCFCFFFFACFFPLDNYSVQAFLIKQEIHRNIALEMLRAIIISCSLDGVGN